MNILTMKSKADVNFLQLNPNVDLIPKIMALEHTDFNTQKAAVPANCITQKTSYGTIQVY